MKDEFDSWTGHVHSIRRYGEFVKGLSGQNKDKHMYAVVEEAFSRQSLDMNDADLLDIGPALPDEATRYATVAAETFFEAYSDTAEPANMALHIAREFGVPQQRRELEDPAITVLAAREASGDWAGFATLHADRAAPDVRAVRPIEVVRFYVRSRWHDRGAAARLMAAAIGVACERGHDAIWLQVWEENARARRFYEKCGLRAVGTKPFLFGEVLERDIVYALSPDPLP